jgi:hypothetical protein
MLIRNRNCYINKFYAERNDVRFPIYRSVTWISEQFIIHIVSSLNSPNHNSPHVCSMYITPHAPNSNCFFFSILAFYTHRFFILLSNSKF